MHMVTHVQVLSLGDPMKPHSIAPVSKLSKTHPLQGAQDIKWVFLTVSPLRTV